jgi:topoisomerase-4 subunit A
LTEIKNFDTISAATVVEANEKLYINREEGFIGTSLKKDEYICNCSDIDDVIIFYKDGTYKVVKVADKIFVGETERSKKEKRKVEIIHVAIFKKSDTRIIYNAVYRDGKAGNYYVKRFNVTSLTRDKEYDLTKGTPGSRVVYFTANPNGEAEVIKVVMKPNPKLKKIFFDYDFSVLAIKGRASLGNLLSKNEIARITLKSHGGSTLGGRKVWWDPDVNRINYDEQGQYLGEFHSDDQILVVLSNGEFYASNFDTNNHYENNILRIEKYKPNKIWTAVLYDKDQNGYAYVKRFQMEAVSRHQNFLGENPDNEMLLLTDTAFPRIKATLGGADSFREPIEIDAEEFIGVKSFKAKGKRITTLNVASIEELEPLRFPAEEEENPENSNSQEDIVDPDDGKSQQDIKDELIGQLHLFD